MMEAPWGWLPAGLVWVGFALMTWRSVRRMAAWERAQRQAAAASTGAMADAPGSLYTMIAFGSAAPAPAAVPDPDQSPGATGALGLSGRRYHGLFRGLAQHFNGDYSLQRSYWVHGVVIGLLTQVLLLAGARVADEELSVRTGSLVVVALVMAQLAVGCWAVIGIWRSAGRHVGRGGSSGWAMAARAAVVLGLIRMLMSMVDAAPAMHERMAYLFGKQVAGGAATVTPLVGGQALLLSGGINDGTALALRDALKRHPKARTLLLDSGGGWVREGSRLAEVIRTARLDTHVEGVCASSCTLALLAGQSRSAAPTARVGFHAARGLGESADKPAGWAARMGSQDPVFGQLYRDAGLPEPFIQRALSTPSEDMWFPSIDELLQAKVLTRHSRGGEWPLLSTRFQAPADVDRWLKEMPAYAALAQRFPADFDRLRSLVWVLSRGAALDDRLVSAARAELRRTLDRVRPLGSHALLDAHLILLRDQLRLLQQRDARACVGLVFPQSVPPVSTAALLTPELRAREQALIVRLLNEADLSVKPDTRQATVVRVARQAMAGMAPEQLRILASATERATQPPELVCRTVIRYFDGLASIPAAERGEALRTMFAQP